MSFVLLGILNSQASGAAQAYFLSVLGQGEGNSSAIDSLDNIYAVGTTLDAGPGSGSFLTVKYDSLGNVQFQRVFGGTEFDNNLGANTDSLDNLYVIGETQSAGAGGRDSLLAKYNSSGTIQWQRVLGSANQDKGRAVAVDSADNVYVAGEANDFEILLAKYDSSGTIEWQRTLAGGGSEIGYAVAVDSADNIYIAADTSSAGAGVRNFLLAKYNSSGTIQWQRILGGAADEQAFSVNIDSLDNVYILGNTDSTGAGGDDLLLAKYDSSGTIQWQRVLGGSGSDLGFSVAIDSADNIYALGNTSSAGAGSLDLLLAKYDSSGTIQYQRVLGGASADRGRSIKIDSLDNLYLFGFTASTGPSSTNFFLAKLPNDGSLEGTYSLDGNNIIYQASTLTAATSSLTAATSSLTSSTASLTSATSTLTDASASLTVVTEEIG